MKLFYLSLAGLCLSITIQSCHKKGENQALSNNDVSKVIRAMSDVMIHDVTNPPLAARFFAYTCLAGYEVISENENAMKSMHGRLNDYPIIKKSNKFRGYNYQLSAVLAMMETASKLQPSGNTLMKTFREKFLDSCRNAGMSNDVIDSSRQYAQFVALKILAYAKSDRYNRISNYPRYKLMAKPGYWDPTPPAYMTPVEPYFNTIRTLTLDSASQFLPEPPIPFSIKKDSKFYKMLLMSYHKSGNGLTNEEKAIANFWDCNPFAVQNNGHMLLGLKKISPGAHWMGITDIACRQARATFSRTVEVNTVVAIGLLDSFIACWEDKYRTNRIRPETAIRLYIDPNWKPLLQTPPFPEYISGHSVISTTSALILTHYFGNTFNYTDKVEIDFGVPSRNFKSFNQAAREASVSRFWGGIHFKDAIDNGIIQGEKVGKHVLNKICSQKGN